MFSFLLDAGTYDSRKVANYGRSEGLAFEVDTVAVSDGRQPYETAIKHPEYHDGEWIVVEAYDTSEDAQVGHDRWVSVMAAESLPDVLVDCGNAAVGQLLEAVGGQIRFERGASNLGG